MFSTNKINGKRCIRSTSNKKYQNEQILRQIYLTQYQNGEVNKTLNLLDKANAKIKKELVKTSNVSTKNRYNQISKTLSEISKSLKQNVDEQLNTEDLIQNEINAQTALFKKIGVNDISLPSEKMIRTAVQFEPFADNSNYESFLDEIQNGLYNTWDNAIRTGYVTGETTSSIVRRVMGTVAKNGEVADAGLINLLKKSIETNVRTFLQCEANLTRNSFFKENDNLIPRYKYFGTLDRRTCLVCGSYDGKVFKTLDEFTEKNMQPPIHHNCRCVILADFGEEETRASENGQTDKLTYEDWLNDQPEDVKNEILGETRTRLYEISKIEGKKINFVNNGKIVSVEKLKSKYPNVAGANKQQPVNGDNFSAVEWSKYFKDSFIEPNEKGIDYLLSNMKDGDEIIEQAKIAQDKNKKLTETYKTYRISGRGADSVYTKERTELHNKIINKIFERAEDATVREGESPKFIMLGGRGGSGKSKFEDFVYNTKKFVKIDADEIKQMLPEYKGYNAGQVHIESSDLVKKALGLAKKNKLNVVYDGTMSTLNASKMILNAFREKGYYTEIDYMFLPPQEAFVRAMGRFSNGGKYDGRFVPFDALIRMTENEKVFDELKNYSDNWNFYSNYGIKRESKPILISSKYS